MLVKANALTHRNDRSRCSGGCQCCQQRVSLHLTCFIFLLHHPREKCPLWSCYRILWAWWSGRKRRAFTKQWSKSLEPDHWTESGWCLHSNPRGLGAVIQWLVQVSQCPPRPQDAQLAHSLPSLEIILGISMAIHCPACMENRGEISKVSLGQQHPPGD